MTRYLRFVIGFMALTMFVGCGASTTTLISSQPPTLSPLFDPNRPMPTGIGPSGGLMAVARSTPGINARIDISPTLSIGDPGAAGSPTPTWTAGLVPSQEADRSLPARVSRTETETPALLRESQIAELIIYDETLNPDWSTDPTWGIELSLADASHSYSGAVAAAVTPKEDYGALFFAVKQGVSRTIPITDVLGVSVWLNSGDGILTPDDLAITVVGSNDYTYWVEGDKSVQMDKQRFFSETRLRYLGITRSVAPEKWVEAVVRLDKLPYEPNYRYITGVYIKNDQGFRRTFYVDHVALLLVRPTPTSRPEATAHPSIAATGAAPKPGKTATAAKPKPGRSTSADGVPYCLCYRADPGAYYARQQSSAQRAP